MPPPFTHKTQIRHRLGTPASEDVLVYEEHDDAFYVSIARDGSERMLYITTGARRRAHVLSMLRAQAVLKLVCPPPSPAPTPNPQALL